MVPAYLGAAAPGVGAMTIEEASIQAMPPIVIRRGCFMISPFIFLRWLARVSDLSRAAPSRRVARRCRQERRADCSFVFRRRCCLSALPWGGLRTGSLLTTSATVSWQGPGAPGGGVRVSPNVTGDAPKGHARRCSSPCDPLHAAEFPAWRAPLDPSEKA